MPVPGPAVDASVERVDERRREAVGTLRRLRLEHLQGNCTAATRAPIS